MRNAVHISFLPTKNFTTILWGTVFVLLIINLGIAFSIYQQKEKNIELIQETESISDVLQQDAQRQKTESTLQQNQSSTQPQSNFPWTSVLQQQLAYPDQNISLSLLAITWNKHYELKLQGRSRSLEQIDRYMAWLQTQSFGRVNLSEVKHINDQAWSYQFEVAIQIS